MNAIFKFVSAERRAFIGMPVATFGGAIIGLLVGEPVRNGLITGICFLLGYLLSRVIP